MNSELVTSLKRIQRNQNNFHTQPVGTVP